ncbi:cytochrome c oxidase subunit II [Pseudoduganella sp. S-14]|uniref:cytochrome c oxidase subunit II n=1 Tax=Pseudoduganella sp. S-14 TaxID=3404065 RepID=UPI003CE7C4DF
MALAISLILIVLGAIIFHWLSPWWLTPIASNWQAMDDALMITLVICAALFIIIHLFVAYAVVKFRHREGHRAAAESHNGKLEWWLIGATSLGIVAMLAPGLNVYAKLISPPADASVFEVMGKQWDWHFRLPGKDNKLGATDVRFINATNPFGINPEDPAGQDDVLVDGSEIHIPLNQPVKVMLRAQDVLHDFYVPQFRTRMNMVPGLVTHFWLTPTQTGRFEVLCAQLCGVGHSNMRSAVVVEEQAVYDAWLAKQPTFSGHGAVGGVGGPAEPGKQGRLIAQSKGCVACHSVDGAPSVGPTWKGLFGRQETLEGGTTVAVDEAYLKQSINDPKAKVVKGFPNIMPPNQLSDEEMAAMIDYIKTVR